MAEEIILTDTEDYIDLIVDNIVDEKYHYTLLSSLNKEYLSRAIIEGMKPALKKMLLKMLSDPALRDDFGFWFDSLLNQFFAKIQAYFPKKFLSYDFTRHSTISGGILYMTLKIELVYFDNPNKYIYNFRFKGRFINGIEKQYT